VFLISERVAVALGKCDQYICVFPYIQKTMFYPLIEEDNLNKTEIFWVKIYIKNIKKTPKGGIW